MKNPLCFAHPHNRSFSADEFQFGWQKKRVMFAFLFLLMKFSLCVILMALINTHPIPGRICTCASIQSQKKNSSSKTIMSPQKKLTSARAKSQRDVKVSSLLLVHALVSFNHSLTCHSCVCISCHSDNHFKSTDTQQCDTFKKNSGLRVKNQL